ncbi:MAG TPA: metal-dependent transcriptional regulator [Gemmatimonadaceae bacterium]|jgi:DtxR family Mn-dependent transcriptional regulator
MTAPRTSQDLSASVEDYLKAIYELEVARGAAATNDIAEALGIAAASVSGMLRRLARQRLVSHEPYRGVHLTRDGRRAALRTIRRHRVIESYLTTALGYPWDRVHDEAERLEHASSDELVDRMAAAIGEPETDPHGAPIPTRQGRLESGPALIPLSELPEESTAQVARVGDRDAERLRYLATLGITIGADVRVTARGPFDGPITFVVGGARRTIGRELASGILLERREGRSTRRR